MATNLKTRESDVETKSRLYKVCIEIDEILKSLPQTILDQVKTIATNFSLILRFEIDENARLIATPTLQGFGMTSSQVKLIELSYRKQFRNLLKTKKFDIDSMIVCVSKSSAQSHLSIEYQYELSYISICGKKFHCSKGPIILTWENNE